MKCKTSLEGVIFEIFGKPILFEVHNWDVKDMCLRFDNENVDTRRSLEGKSKLSFCMDIEIKMGSTQKPAKGLEGQKLTASKGRTIFQQYFTTI